MIGVKGPVNVCRSISEKNCSSVPLFGCFVSLESSCCEEGVRLPLGLENIVVPQSLLSIYTAFVVLPQIPNTMFASTINLSMFFAHAQLFLYSFCILFPYSSKIHSLSFITTTHKNP